MCKRISVKCHGLTQASGIGVCLCGDGVGGWCGWQQAAALIYVVQYAEPDSWWRNGYIANLAWDVSEAIPLWSGVPMGLYTRIAIITFWVSAITSALLALLSRVLLRLLLGWHSPMYTPPKEMGLKVKLWGLAVKLLRGEFAPVWILSAAHLYGYSTVMPYLPVPDLETTVSKYLKSIRPLFSAEELKKREDMAASFLENEGPGLQRLLKLKWLISTNYVTDW